MIFKHGNKEHGKVVGLPTIADSIGFGLHMKDRAWVRWEGGSSSWHLWSDLQPLRRSPNREKRADGTSYREGSYSDKFDEKNGKRTFSQPTLFSKKGRRDAWLVCACLYPPPPHVACTPPIDRRRLDGCTTTIH